MKYLIDILAKASSSVKGLAKAASDYADMPAEKQANVDGVVKRYAGWGLIALAVVGVGSGIYYVCKNKSDANKEDRKQQAQGKRETEVVKARGEAQKDCQVAIIEAKGREERETIKARTEFYKEKVASAIEKVQAIRERRQNEKAARTTAVDLEDDSFDRDDYRDWLADFREKYSRPIALPYPLQIIISGVPEGHEEAMLSHLLQAYGALCFSRVRARYTDGKLHAPSLLTIIEASSGSGKDKYRIVYDLIFEDTLELDDQKMELLDQLGNNNTAPRVIIQTVRTGMSKAKFVDTIANNQGVHMDLLETEISVLTRDIRSGKGAFEYDYLRQAYDNDPIYRNTRSKAGRNGRFPINLNATLLGTPSDVDTFIKDEVDTGTAPRFTWAGFPRPGKKIPKLNLPTDAELQAIRNQITNWREKYCYSTQDGNDIPCNEYQIDLDFVASELERWCDDQFDLAEKENDGIRRDVRSRIAATAFHMGMVFYMLYGEPSSRQSDLRQQVVDWTIYMANYIMERYLHKFGPSKPIPPLNFAAHCSLFEPDNKTPREMLSEDRICGLPRSMVNNMAADHYLKGIGWGTLATKYGIYNKYGDHDRQRVKRAVLKHGLEQDKTDDEQSTLDSGDKPEKTED